MRDLIRLIDTVDCVTPGCPHEAERDGLCRHCTAAQTRPRKAWDPAEAIRQLAPTSPGVSQGRDAAPIATSVDTPPPDAHRPLERDEKWTADRCILAARAWRDEHGKPPKSKEWQSGGLSPREWPRYHHVRRHWDTWDAFLTAAGLPLHPRPAAPSTTLKQPQPEPETSSPESEGTPPSEPEPDVIPEGSGTGDEVPLPDGWTRLWTREIDFIPYGWDLESGSDLRWLPLNVAAIHMEECAAQAIAARDRYLDAIDNLEVARLCFDEISQVERAKVDDLLWEAP